MTRFCQPAHLAEPYSTIALCRVTAIVGVSCAWSCFPFGSPLPATLVTGSAAAGSDKPRLVCCDFSPFFLVTFSSKDYLSVCVCVNMLV